MNSPSSIWTPNSLRLSPPERGESIAEVCAQYSLNVLTFQPARQIISFAAREAQLAYLILIASRFRGRPSMSRIRMF